MRLLRLMALVWMVGGTSGCFLFEPEDDPVLTVSVVDWDLEGVQGVTVEVEEDLVGRTQFIGSRVTDESGIAKFDVDEYEHLVHLVDPPYGYLFEETTLALMVRYPGADVEFRALPRGRVEIRGVWAGEDRGIVPEVLLELLDQGGTVRQQHRGPWPSMVPFAVPRQPHQIRISDFPDWVAFDETIVDVFPEGPDTLDVTFTATYVGQRVAEVRVFAADGSPIEGVTVEFLESPSGALLASGVTDVSGVFAWVWPTPGPSVARISDFDAALHTFASTEMALQIDAAPGPYVVRFDAGGANGNQPPVAMILDPREGDTFTEGETVLLAGFGADPEEGTLTGSALAWASDVDGALGAGTPLNLALSVGTHVITLVATDAEGAADTTSVTIDVLANQPPAASIIRPTDGTVFTAGQPASFIGTAVDAEDGFLSGPSLVWASSLDRAIGQGDSITVSTLQAGAHQITLTATDAAGAVDADTIDVTISATGTATIQGAITLSGAGFSGITVTATGPSVATAVTDTFGSYVLGGLAAGTYTVTVSGLPAGVSVSPASVSVTVAEGETVTQDFALTGG